MKTSIQIKSALRFFTLPLALILGWVALPQAAQAVVPPPDGGYPGFNTAEGTNALKNLTTGVADTAVGWFSLFSNTDGSFNTGVGAGTLVLNVGNQGTGEGVANTAVGAVALFLNTTGSDNTAVGTAALLNNDGDTNTAVGAFALNSNTEGFVNTATGAFALFRNTTGLENTAVGFAALQNNTDGGANTAVGNQALLANSIGQRNTALGFGALSRNTTGSNNIALGLRAGFDVITANNVICIGDSVFGANIDDSCYIGNIFDATAVLGTAVFVSSDNKLGTITSSKRFKQDIKSMDSTSEALFSLKPVTFRYKKEIDSAGTAQFGLVAEEVEKVNPDLVVRDKGGKPYSVRYDQVNAMLLNEFLKEHRKVEEQQKDIDALRAELKEQRDLIQKVSDRVEMTKTLGLVTKNP